MKAMYIAILMVVMTAPVMAAKPAESVKVTVDTKDETPKPVITNITHAAIGAKVTVSSTSKGDDGEAGAEALVDGNLTTRWSSEYSSPQRITIELEKARSIAKIRLYWESAFATKYNILVSQDGEGWTPAHFFFRVGAKRDARIDTCDMKFVKAKHIMIELNERVNKEWGYSLYEVEVLADTKVVIP